MGVCGYLDVEGKCNAFISVVSHVELIHFDEFDGAVSLVIKWGEVEEQSDRLFQSIPQLSRWSQRFSL